MYIRKSLLILILLLGSSHLLQALERTRLGLVQIDEFSLLAGLEYSEGDYGTPDTTTLWKIPLNLTYRKNQYSFTASLPLLSAQSDGEIIITNKTSKKKTTTTTSTTSESSSGIGDFTLSGTYYFLPTLPDELTYRITGIIKLGTASASENLGTGETDLAIEGGLQKPVNKIIYSASIGYVLNGDSDTYDYNNVFYTYLGLTGLIDRNKNLGGTLYLSEAVTDTTEAPAELSVFYSQAILTNKNIYFYYTKGLSNGSPDFALGATLQFYF